MGVNGLSPISWIFLSLMSLSGLLAYGTSTSDHSEKKESDYLGTHSILLDPFDRRHRWHDPRAPWHSPRRFVIPHQCTSCAADVPRYGRIYWCLPVAFTCPVHREKLHTRQSTRVGLMANRRAEVVPDPVYWLDEITCQGLATGNVRYFDSTLPIGLWLQLLRTVIDELLVKYSQKPRATNFIREVWRAVGNRPSMSAGQSFESLKATQQIRLMHGAAIALKLIGSGDAYLFGASAHLLVPNPKPCRIAKTNALQ